MTDRNIARLLLLAVPCIVLQGCAPAIFGGAATGVAIAYDRRTTGTVVEDQAIEIKAANAIYSDEELRQKTHISVTSYNNVVLMTGEAPTEELKQRAADLVVRIDKVRHVHNELTVSTPSTLVSRSTDGFISTKVKAKLLTVKDFDGLQVKVVTEKGAVFLMGLVTRREAEVATEIARRVGGVQKVVKLFEYTDK